MFHIAVTSNVSAVRWKLGFSTLFVACWLAGCCTAAGSDRPEEIIGGFDQRVDAMFRAESGQALVRAKKQKPLGPGRGNYVRAYSYSMVGFAARCLYLGEMLDKANAAIAENAQHYLDNPKDINDRDSFHWHAEIVLRLIEMYGSQGSRNPGASHRRPKRLRCSRSGCTSNRSRGWARRKPRSRKPGTFTCQRTIMP